MKLSTYSILSVTSIGWTWYSIRNFSFYHEESWNIIKKGNSNSCCTLVRNGYMTTYNVVYIIAGLVIFSKSSLAFVNEILNYNKPKF